MRWTTLGACTVTLLFASYAQASGRPLLVVVESDAGHAAAVRTHIEEATSRRVVDLSDPDASSSPAVVSIAFDEERQRAWIWHHDARGSFRREVQAPAGARDFGWIGAAVARLLADAEAMRWTVTTEIIDPFGAARERRDMRPALVGEVIDPWQYPPPSSRTAEVGAQLSEPHPSR